MAYQHLLCTQFKLATNRKESTEVWNEEEKLSSYNTYHIAHWSLSENNQNEIYYYTKTHIIRDDTLNLITSYLNNKRLDFPCHTVSLLYQHYTDNIFWPVSRVLKLCKSDNLLSVAYRGGGGVKPPPPQIPKAPQNHAKLNPIVKTVKKCWI